MHYLNNKQKQINEKNKNSNASDLRNKYNLNPSFKEELNLLNNYPIYQVSQTNKGFKQNKYYTNGSTQNINAVNFSKINRIPESKYQPHYTSEINSHFEDISLKQKSAYQILRNTQAGSKVNKYNYGQASDQQQIIIPSKRSATSSKNSGRQMIDNNHLDKYSKRPVSSTNKQHLLNKRSKSPQALRQITKINYDNKTNINQPRQTYHKNQIRKQHQTLPLKSQQINKVLNSFPNNLQQDFRNLSKTITNLRTYGEKQIQGSSYNYGVPSVPSTVEQLNLKNSLLQLNSTMPVASYSGTVLANQTQNLELYQMMKSILVGQQRLEKQLLLLKNKESQAQQIKTLITDKNAYANKLINQNTNYNQGKKTKRKQQSQTICSKVIDQNKIKQAYSKLHTNQQRNTSPNRFSYGNKSNLKSRSRSKSAKRYDNQPLSISPAKSQNSKSPKLQKQKLQNKTILKKTEDKKPRAVSAINPGKIAGKICTNKQKFYELYVQAQNNKRLSNSQNRIQISPSSISSVWQKIKNVLERTCEQNKQTSTIFHENNKFVNDHLINTIELQKKLKSDLLKKVYEMCGNKCLFK